MTDMLKKAIFITILIVGFIYWGTTSPADSTIDSIRSYLLANSVNDEILMDSLLNKARKLIGTDLAEAEIAARQALSIAYNLRSKLALARCCHRLGIIWKNQEKWVDADNMLNDGYRYAKKIGEKIIMAQCLNGMGDVRKEIEDFDKALEYFTASAKLFEEVNEVEKAMETRNNIGTIYISLHKPAQAYELYCELIEYFEAEGRNDMLVRLYINMGEVMEHFGKMDSAMYFFQNSYRLVEGTGDIYGLMDANRYLGKIFSQTNNLKVSTDYLNTALLYAEQLSVKRELSEILKYLSNNYAGTGDSAKAYELLIKSTALEINFNAQNASKEIAKKELYEQNRISQNRTRMFYFSMAGLFVSLLMVVTIYRGYRIKRNANRVLVDMDQLKSRLFSNITHEFRTPLTLIISPLEEMSAAGEKKDPTPDEISMMKRNANRLLTLVNQMLDLAKLDARSMKIELTQADFVSFFRWHVLSFRSLAEQKGIDFTWEIPEMEFSTWFDHDKSEKVINNLLSNALKFTGHGGSVSCRLDVNSGKNEEVEFRISDSGIGIPKSELNKIFDRFHQVEETRPGHTIGTGIGLSLTKELVELLHGTISVDSEPGKGSSFTVSLPLGIKHLRTSEYILLRDEMLPNCKPSSDDILEPVGLNGIANENPGRVPKKDLPVILIVEDQKEIREYLGGQLAENYKVLEAENGKRGLESAIRSIPDLVITDLLMPEMNGLELCKKLKSDERTSHIPVVMLTALSTVEDRLEGIEMGADIYMTKPFNAKELRVVVANLIAQRKKLRERFSRDIRLDPKDIAITSADEKFLNRAIAVIEAHLDDAEFEVNGFQAEMSMSRMQLFRKIKALTDQTPSEFIRTFRLKRAASLIEKNFGNIAEITYEVGFSNPSYFAKCFKELFGVLPSEYEKKPLKS